MRCLWKGLKPSIQQTSCLEQRQGLPRSHCHRARRDVEAATACDSTNASRRHILFVHQNQRVHDESVQTKCCKQNDTTNTARHRPPRPRQRPKPQESSSARRSCIEKNLSNLVVQSQQ